MIQNRHWLTYLHQRKKVHLYFFGACLIILSSCGNIKQKEKSAKTPSQQIPKQVFQVGKIYPKVSCAQGPAFSYSLYLPHEYRTGKPSPVIFFFDAHARGWLPIAKYKNLADSLGYILVASNDSKNGLSSTKRNEIIYQFMADVEHRFTIDSRRIYTSGFSGGARIASGIGIANQYIAGVMGCAAGFPQVSTPIRTDFAYVGIVGNKDFNYLEMRYLDQKLEANHQTHLLLIFDGKHEWPPARVMRRAMLFMEMDAMRKNLIPGNEPQIAKTKEMLEQDRNKASVVNDAWARFRADQQLVACLSGLAPVQNYRIEMDKLRQSRSFQKRQVEDIDLLHEESKSQQNLSNALQVQDENWWQQKIAQIYKHEKSANSNDIRLMNRRLLNYLSLMAYLYVDGNLKQGNANSAGKYLMIYEKVDPTNPEVYFLKAQQRAMLGGSAHAIYHYLEKAVKMGFQDTKRFNNLPYFASLRQSLRFQNLAKQVLQNHEKAEEHPSE